MTMLGRWRNRMNARRRRVVCAFRDHRWGHVPAGRLAVPCCVHVCRRCFEVVGETVDTALWSVSLLSEPAGNAAMSDAVALATALVARDPAAWDALAPVPSAALTRALALLTTVVLGVQGEEQALALLQSVGTAVARQRP